MHFCMGLCVCNVKNSVSVYIIRKYMMLPKLFFLFSPDSVMNCVIRESGQMRNIVEWANTYIYFGFGLLFY